MLVVLACSVLRDVGYVKLSRNIYCDDVIDEIVRMCHEKYLPDANIEVVSLPDFYWLHIDSKEYADEFLGALLLDILSLEKLLFQYQECHARVVKAYHKYQRDL